jgi:hypothetical protein
MPAERLSMRQIREVLRLRFASKLPQRAIAKSLGLSQGAVSGYLSRARAAGVVWAWVHCELRRPNVTLALLWEEYRAGAPDGFGYSWFCDLYRVVNDPLLLIPAMAYVTRNLGFGVTCAVSYEHPYMLARRFSTLDHLTGGRIGWNVVTGYLNSAAKGIGLARQPEHDTRYEIRRRIHADRLQAVGRQLGTRGGAARPHATRVRAAGERTPHTP